MQKRSWLNVLLSFFNMSHLDFYKGLQDDVTTLGYRRIVKESFPPVMPTSSREACFSHHNNYGATGKGKTIAVSFITLEKYVMKEKQFGIDGFKILWIDVLGKGEMACLPPQTLIPTKSSLKPILSVNVGDYVLSKDGLFHKVTKIFQRNFEGKLIKVYPWNFSFPLSLTPEHPILTATLKKNSQKRKILDPIIEWKNASSLTKEDYVAFPIYSATSPRIKQLKITQHVPNLARSSDGFVFPNKRKTIKIPHTRLHKPGYTNCIPNLLAFTPDLCRLFGYFVAEGSTCKGRRLTFSFGSHETKYIEDVKNLLQSIFAINVKIRNRGSSTVLQCWSVVLARLFRKLFGSNARNKTIPAWLLRVPRKYLAELIKGLWRGDGCVYIDKGNYEFHYATSSIQLVYSLLTILTRLGFSPSISCKKKNKGLLISTPNPLWYVRIHGFQTERFGKEILDLPIPKNGNRNRQNIWGFVDGRYFWMKIRKIEQVPYNGLVYNLEIKKTESYVANSFLVHNCCFHPMDERHPLFPACQQIKLPPESYPVEVLRPLVFVRGKPDLLYEQPNIVKPFTIALSDIALMEWGCLLPSGLSSGQANLLTKALNELDDVETASIYDVYVKCQQIVEQGNVGYGSHIEQMKGTPTIPLTKAVFSGREAKGLLQKLEVISDTGLVQPLKWKGKRVKTNLDLNKLLTDQKTISVLLVPRYKDLPHLNIGIINYILNHVYHLKHPNNPNRVTQPLCITVPELRNLVPKHIPERSRYFIEPVKNTMLEINSSGAGIGISLVGDTQFFEQIDDEYRANVNSVFIFDLGEEAGEKIRELVKNRFVSNFKEITDNYHLSALKDVGTFIYLGYGSTHAEIRKNALVGFWYPRARGVEGETETNFYDLFKRVYPERMVDIGSLYGLILQINMDCQTRASEKMTGILIETKQKKKKKTPEQKQAEAELKVLEALMKVCEEKNYFDYKEITGLLVPLLERSRMQIQRYLKGLAQKGFIIIDDSQGRKHKKVMVDKDKIGKTLKEFEEEE